MGTLQDMIIEYLFVNYLLVWTPIWKQFEAMSQKWYGLAYTPLHALLDVYIA